MKAKKRIDITKDTMEYLSTYAYKRNFKKGVINSTVKRYRSRLAKQMNFDPKKYVEEMKKKRNEGKQFMKSLSVMPKVEQKRGYKKLSFDHIDVRSMCEGQGTQSQNASKFEKISSKLELEKLKFY